MSKPDSANIAENHPHPSRGEFEAILNKVLADDALKEGRVVKGRVTQIENDAAIVDVGLKTEGRVMLREFGAPGRRGEVNIGDEVEVYVERIENMLGEAVLSCDKARREGAWKDLEKAHAQGHTVTGVITSRVKGGATVDLGGAMAFLPGSQIDVRPIQDVNALIDQELDFQILKIDRERNNIVVSRRAVLEESRIADRHKMLETLKEGDIVEGVVKNITDYGAFVDLGGIDGLLHVTQISWRRINYPSEILNTGDKIKVQVIRINNDTQRINLSMKHLEADPWNGVAEKYAVKAKIRGRVTNITEYGAFIELEPGVEGLVHISEMSWLKTNTSPEKIVSISQEVDAVVLEIDMQKRRISLGMKQCEDNPWAIFASQHPLGTKVSGAIKNITDFGLFIGLDDNLDGMVHMSDLSWDEDGEAELKKYKQEQVVEVVILAIDPDKERISLGIKQLTGGDLEARRSFKKKDVVTCTVLETKESGIDVDVGTQGVRAFIRRAELARERSEQRPDRFAIGQKVDAQIVQSDPQTGKLVLSIRALEIADEKEAVAQYGSAESGASLGDILGRVMKIGRKKTDSESGSESSAAQQDEAPSGESESDESKSG